MTLNDPAQLNQCVSGGSQSSSSGMTLSTPITQPNVYKQKMDLSLHFQNDKIKKILLALNQQPTDFKPIDFLSPILESSLDSEETTIDTKTPPAVFKTENALKRKLDYENLAEIEPYIGQFSRIDQIARKIWKKHKIELDSDKENNNQNSANEEMI